ncbi:hypothetical protein UA17_01765 [Burkholderia multivorans]|uniref:hypothetical protein n=1 Tax=Burkholderia multivorans TaxID=87883 RepID=UPI0009E0DB1F|nr:hypothetical protein [Burkholderia multivorans]SAK19225.1 hypothetical protein UA17_01765 [Burkholderia multivorans]
MSDVQTDQNQEPPTDASEVVEHQEHQEHPRPDTSWVPKRISEITAARRAAEERAAAAEAELARLRAAGTVDPATPQPTNPQDIQRLVDAAAERLANERLGQQELVRTLSQIEQTGKKEFGADYDAAVANLQMAGVGGHDFLRAIAAVPNPEKVLIWLGKNENVGEAIRIASLDPLQMGIELAKTSGAAAKALSKQISKVPPPIQPVDGASRSDNVEPAVGTPEWFKWRNETARRKR